MADGNGESAAYLYVVLTLVGEARGAPPAGPTSPLGPRTWAEIRNPARDGDDEGEPHDGAWPAGNADRAIEDAVAEGGMPLDSGRCVAVPLSRWHDRPVLIKHEPRIIVGEDEDSAAVTSRIPVDPPEEPTAA